MTRQRKKNLPKRLQKKGKYTEAKFFNKQAFDSLDIPENLKNVLAKSANFSLAIKTKSAYRTAVNMLVKCQEETKENLSFPLSESKVLVFVAWGIKRGYKDSTLKSYMAGLKKAHIANNFQPPNMSTPLINSVLEGHSKKINQKARNKKPKRLPCTLNTLRLIKQKLAKSQLPNSEKVAFHATCTTLFFGAIRAGEALTKSEKAYDPSMCITNRDLKFVEKSKSEEKRSVEITIKNSKTNKSKIPETIVIYETGDHVCPVRALQKLVDHNKNLPKDFPLFASSDGRPITHQRLNNMLNEFINPHLPFGKLSGHSFRSGLISIFAKAGYSNDQLKQIGRWSSRAFKCYIKSGKTARHQMAVACSSVNKLT